MSEYLIKQYFDAFNQGDIDGMLACLSEDVAHHVNEGQIRRGKAEFRTFCTHMNTCYRETLSQMVIMTSPEANRAAAEYIVDGTYLETDAGLPEASGQTYRLPAGSFFDIESNRITRVTTYYNLADWIRQIGS